MTRRGGPLAGSAGFAAAAFAFAVAMLGTTLPTPLYPLYQARFGFSELTITVIFAVYAAGVITALLLTGRVSDEVGRRPVLLAGLALAALAAIAFLLADGLPVLLVGRILSGLSAGIFTGTATATLVDLLGAGQAGRATLGASLANMGGLGTGPLLSGVLASIALSVRLPFWVNLGLLVPATAAILMIREPLDARGRFRLRPQALSVPAEMRATFINAALAGFAGFAVLGLCSAVAPAFLGNILGVTSLVIIGLVAFSAFAASTAGQLLLELVPRSSAMPAGCAGLIVGMAFLAAGLALTSLGLVVAGVILAGASQGLSFRAGLAGVNSAAPADRRSEVASSFFVVCYIAISVPVIGEGLLAQLVGLRAAGLVFAGVVAAVAAIVLVLLARQRAADGVAAAR